jgi:hypothetical protein
MISKLAPALGIAIFSLIANGAMAQDTVPCQPTNEKWSVCVAEQPKGCWAVAEPGETVNTRDGAVVAVRRGEIRLFVSYGSGANGEVSFTGGYPFKPDSTVALTIDSQTFQLFTQGEWAWARPEDDAKIVAAMKKGAQAVAVASSSRGTRTEDKFSLIGFTAAVDDAAKRCE